ncbi:MAG: moaA1 [Lachnospiraceae bacterium]|nr:moaA1 [Lachnospiraceae bacterium]
MLNLFITYNCNFNCDYCFIRGFGNEYSMYLQEDNFRKLCNWLKEHKVYSLGILGGEPTTHPKLVEMLERLNECGVAPVLFTNGLFHKDLREPLADLVANFVINYNDPAMYTKDLWNKMQDNLMALKTLGANISFSKNFSKGMLRYDYILEGAEKLGVTSIRYDISRPNPMEANNYFNLEESKALVGNIVEFVRECENRSIKTGLDCCVPLCYFDSDTLNYMREVSMKFTGICHPSMDIQTDLSATYCIPMQHVNIPDITEFDGELDLLGYFAGQVKDLRRTASKSTCKSCQLFGSQCQGGCLSLKKALLD